MRVWLDLPDDQPRLWVSSDISYEKVQVALSRWLVGVFVLDGRLQERPGRIPLLPLPPRLAHFPVFEYEPMATVLIRAIEDVTKAYR